MVERMDQLSYLIPVELFLKYFSIDSSNVHKVIRLILNFFLRKDFTRTASTKRTQANKNKKGSVFMLLKKHLWGKKSLIQLFAFLFFCLGVSVPVSAFCFLGGFFVLFVLFVFFCDFSPFCACEIFLKKKLKTALITSFILLLNF